MLDVLDYLGQGKTPEEALSTVEECYGRALNSELPDLLGRHNRCLDYGLVFG